MGFAYVNGEFVEEHDASVALSERGFLYGDGLFETVRVADGVPVFLDRHTRRMHGSALELGIALDRREPDFSSYVGNLVAEIIERSGYSEARLRIILSRGERSDGPRPSEEGRSNLYLSINSEPAKRLDQAHSGVRAVICSFPRNQRSPLARHKTLNYQENVLALREAEELGVDEAIFRNLDGRLSEGATTNLFLIKGDELVTPPVSEGLLPGVTRACVLELAASLEIDSNEEPVTVDDLRSCEEAFLTNSIIGVAPLLELDGRPVGQSCPGPVTKRLQGSYRVLVDNWAAKR